MTGESRWGVLGLAVTFGILSIAMIVLAIQQHMAASAAHAWPRVEGVVVHSEIKHVPQLFVKYKSIDGFVPAVHCEYEVEGDGHVCRRINNLDTEKQQPFYFKTKQKAEKWRAKHYPLGKKAWVYYSPGDPSNSVLQPGASWKGAALFMACLSFLPTCLFTLIFIFSRADSGSKVRARRREKVARKPGLR